MRSVSFAILLAASTAGAALGQPAQPRLDGAPTSWVHAGKLAFRDLNRNGRLDPYEDWRLAPSARASDLVRRMTLAEKAGAMMHGTAPTIDKVLGTGTHYDLALARRFILDGHVTTFVTRLNATPEDLARQNNQLQMIAADGRLGIPVILSTDPRNHFQYVPGASVAANGFSQWPETLGFAALREPSLTRRFAAIVREEYRAVGIGMALSPQADLATEPRWPRINGTFGEDVATVIAQSGAYVRGMQNGARGLRPGGVIAVAKHWVGYGASAGGFDGHNYYGRFLDLDERALRLHIAAFRGVFAAGAAGVMPTYSILRGTTLDGKLLPEVGAGFSQPLLGLLRNQGFRGMVLSDFGITKDCEASCRDGGIPGSFYPVGMDWGVEGLSRVDRFAKAANAGIDQFGGTEEADLLLEAIRQGKVREPVIDAAVRRIVEPIFAMGAFERSLVDPALVAQQVDAPASRALARRTQARAMVLLKGSLPPAAPRSRRRLYLVGIEPGAAREAGFEVVSDPATADLAVVRISAPYQTLHPGYRFGAQHHEGDLDFKPADAGLKAIETLSGKVPVAVFAYLDRPAILTPLLPKAAALIVDFGASDAAILDVVSRRVDPSGRLPFELPATMDAVRAQRSGLPHDSARPLFPIGYRERPRP